MTTKKDCVALDTMSCILHAAEQGVSFEIYMHRVTDYGRKRIRMIGKGLKGE
jgi:hypothetical protein